MDIGDWKSEKRIFKKESDYEKITGVNLGAFVVADSYDRIVSHHRTPTDSETVQEAEFNPRIYIQTDKPILSELTPEEQYQFLIEAGVEIPEFVTGDAADVMFISGVIAGTEMYPNYLAAVSYQTMMDFGDAIRDAVNAYYEREPLLTQYPYEEQLRILAGYGANISEKNLESYANFIQLSIYLSEIQNRQSIVSNPVADEIGKEILDAVNAYYYAHPNALETLAYVRQQGASGYDSARIQ